MHNLKENLELENRTIFIIGVAGFIGSHLVYHLLQKADGIKIIGIDNLNGYYDIGLKKSRLDKVYSIVKRKQTNSRNKFVFYQVDISDKFRIMGLFGQYHPSIVVNLAAQAGVRYSIENPDSYISSNILGFYNILEACRHSYDDNLPGVRHLIYASSSSVYGSNIKVPFSEEDLTDTPVSLYAATKKTNELLAYSYSKLYNIPCTGLRFFTVYGPAGRPDMAYFLFTEKLRAGEKIRIFNYGNCQRDFTYVDDVIEGLIRVMQGAPKKASGSDGLSIPPSAVYNIGNGNPESLLDFVHILSEELVRMKGLPENFNVEEHMELVPMQPGDVPITYADKSKLERDFGFKPSTDLRTGLRAFAEWYMEYYKV